MGGDAEARSERPAEDEGAETVLSAAAPILAPGSTAEASLNRVEQSERGRPPIRLSTAQLAGIIFLAVFTVFITWRTKSLEEAILRRRPTPELLSKNAPDFSLPTLDARTISRADYRGKKTVVVSYWASWCLPCRAELPELRDFYKRYHLDNSDFEVLAISLDEEKSDAEQYASAEKLPFPVLLDPKSRAAEAYSVDGIPTLFVINKNGKVTYVHEGLEAGLQFQLMSQLRIEFPRLEKRGEK
jgi:peroxiredoxin